MSTGVMALEDSGRVNFTNLRTERRARLFAAMDEANLEVLILGRTSNIHYTTGARLLWRSGVFPFAPMCIVVRSTEKTHLLSCWDDGIPPEIGREEDWLRRQELAQILSHRHSQTSCLPLLAPQRCTTQRSS